MEFHFKHFLAAALVMIIFVLIVHTEIFSGKFYPTVYSSNRLHVEEGIAQDASWRILRVAPIPNIPVAHKISNSAKTIRAFVLDDTLYVEQHDPQKTFVIAGNFFPHKDKNEMRFDGQATLVVPVSLPTNDKIEEMILRADLDKGIVRILPIEKNEK